MQETAASMVDVTYPVHGSEVPRDHRRALAEAVARLVPWLAGPAPAGSHRSGDY